LPVIACYIQKEVDYFGERRTLGNTYHYLVSNPDSLDDEAMAIEVKNAEKAVATQEVKFVGWRTWGPTDGSEFANVMREDGVFNEFGTLANILNMYREQCLLAVWPLTRSVATNRKRWLRKFLRLSYPPGLSPSASVQAGSSAMSAAQLAAVKSSYADQVANVGPVNEYDLCTAQGDVPTGGAVIRPYYYTRQIGN
jgi:hypothetical protein